MERDIILCKTKIGNSHVQYLFIALKAHFTNTSESFQYKAAKSEIKLQRTEAS